MFDIEFISRITKTSRKQRERLVELYSTVEEEVRLKLIEEQVRISRQMRQEYYRPEKNVEYIYVCIILSVKNCLTHATVAGKRPNVNLELVDKIRTKSAIKRKEGRKQRLIRLRFFTLIQSLKNEDRLSWAEIAAYLAKNHGFMIASGYLQQVMLSLQKTYSTPVK